MPVRLIIFSLIFLFHAALFAQVDYKPGYVIKNNGDTLHGYINDNDDYTYAYECQLKTEISTFRTFYTYAIDEIKVIYILNQHYYKRMSLPDKADQKVFAEIILQGEKDLVRYQDQYYLADDEKLFHLKNDSTRTYQKVLSSALKDCKTIEGDIKKTTVKRKPLVKLFKKYHRCINADYLYYKGRVTFPETAFTLFGGYGISTLKFTSQHLDYLYLTHDHFDPTHIPYIGCRINMHIPHTYKYITLLIEPGISHAKYTASLTNPNDYFSVNDIEYNLTSFKLPLGLSHEFGSQNFSPSVSFGITNYYHFQKESYRIERFTANQKEEKKALELRTLQHGFFIGFGLYVPFRQNHRIYFEARYENLNEIEKRDLPNEAELYSNMNNFQFITGFTF